MPPGWLGSAEEGVREVKGELGGAAGVVFVFFSRKAPTWRGGMKDEPAAPNFSRSLANEPRRVKGAMLKGQMRVLWGPGRTAHFLRAPLG